MATRNLTKKFVEMRSGSKANRSLRVDSSGEDTGYVSDSGLLNVKI